jgi:hypothetical protein
MELAEFPLSKLPSLAHAHVQAAVYTVIIELPEARMPLIHKLFLITEENIRWRRESPTTTIGAHSGKSRLH